MNPRVLMVTRETGPDRRYGLGRSLMPVVAALRAQGLDVRYFCQEDLEDAQLEQRGRIWRRLCAAPLLRGRPDWLAMARAWLERLQVGSAAAKLAMQDGYTHIHAHDPWIAVGVWWTLRRRAGIRWGVTEHGFGSYGRATLEDGLPQGPVTQRLLRRIEAAVLARAHWVMAPTRAALTQLAHDLSTGAVLPAHWHEVPHARPAIVPASASSRAATRARLGWEAGDFVVLGVGRIVPLKCFDRLVEACARQSHPRLRLVILGGGETAALQEQAARLGLNGRLDTALVDDVTPCLQGADLYVSASRTESFGLANLEALCAGVASICSPAGGVPDVVGDGAWLVPNQVEALTQAISAMISDESARQQWAARAAARGAAWPAAEEVARRYVEIYQAAAR